MPPLQDDATIDPDQSLIRAPRPGWTATREDGTERPNRLAFVDGRTQEASCFIDNDTNLAELRRLFPGDKICRFAARFARDAGFVIQRKPGDCPPGFVGDPVHHLVIGPAEEKPKKALLRMGDALALTPGIEILPPAADE